MLLCHISSRNWIHCYLLLLLEHSSYCNYNHLMLTEELISASIVSYKYNSNVLEMSEVVVCLENISYGEHFNISNATVLV